MVSIKVKVESWNDVPAKRKRVLLSMTLSTGMMRDYTRKTKPQVYTAYLTGQFKGKKVGWAALHLRDGHAMFYVREEYRKHGVAKALMDAIVKDANEAGVTVKVYPHDYKSEEFFNKYLSLDNVKIGSQWSLESQGYRYGTHYSTSEKNPKDPWRPTIVS